MRELPYFECCYSGLLSPLGLQKNYLRTLNLDFNFFYILNWYCCKLVSLTLVLQLDFFWDLFMLPAFKRTDGDIESCNLCLVIWDCALEPCTLCSVIFGNLTKIHEVTIDLNLNTCSQDKSTQSSLKLKFFHFIFYMHVILHVSKY